MGHPRVLVAKPVVGLHRGGRVQRSLPLHPEGLGEGVAVGERGRGDVAAVLAQQDEPGVVDGGGREPAGVCRKVGHGALDDLQRPPALAGATQRDARNGWAEETSRRSPRAASAAA